MPRVTRISSQTTLSSRKTPINCRTINPPRVANPSLSRTNERKTPSNFPWRALRGAAPSTALGRKRWANHQLASPAMEAAAKKVVRRRSGRGKTATKKLPPCLCLLSGRWRLLLPHEKRWDLSAHIEYIYKYGSYECLRCLNDIRMRKLASENSPAFFCTLVGCN